MPALEQDPRTVLLRTAVITGAALTLITELLSAFGQLNRPALIVAWLLFAAAQFKRPSKPAYQWLLLTPTLLLAWIAWLSPPNVYDALAYHLPRVVFWVQQGNVNFFPTTYLNQLRFPPFAEYVTLHTWLLTGGDRLANLPQWAGFTGGIIAVSALAKQLGASRKGQIYAAIFAATIPNAVLQSTGAKNDCVLTFWLLCACYFIRSPWLAGISIALALLTKGTAWIFLPPLLLALPFPRKHLITAAAILILNGPFYLRNIQFSGSPLGPDSAHGDGVHREQNGKYGPGVTFSNATRGLAAHVAHPLLFDTVTHWHHQLGINPNDPATTWPDAVFAPTPKSNHEANSPNTWHLALLIIAVPYCLWRTPTRPFALAWIAAWLLFFTLLRWQPYGARLHLPLFFLGAVFIGIWLDKMRWFPILLCLFLLNNVRPYVFNNWLRPLRGPNSILKTTREENYFRDVGKILSPVETLDTVNQIAQSGCTEIAIDTNHLELEYPFMALLLQRNPKVRFRHVNVNNSTTQYAPPNEPLACALITPKPAISR